MAQIDKTDQKDEDLCKQNYSLKVSVIKQKLEIAINDKKTKCIYHGSFDSNDLKNCGFGTEHSSNLESIRKFIESAKNGHKNISFTLSIANNYQIATINIIKNDEFFPMKITLKLKQKPREKIDILEEEITDLKIENKMLKENILKLESICSKSAFGEFLRINQFQTNGLFTKLSLEIAVYHKNIELKNGGFKFKYNGIYKISIGHRGGNGGNDVWTNFWVKDENGNVVGSSNKFGNTTYAPQQHSYTFLIEVNKINEIYIIEMGRSDSKEQGITIIGCGWNTDNNNNITNTNSIVTVVVNYIGSL